MYISVVGASSCGEKEGDLAYRVGREIALRGHILVCGGLSGVMEESAHGSSDAGGTSVGILPGADRQGASRWLTVSVPTGMGEARNAMVARACDAMIALGGGFGTLSEIALALKMGKPVVGIGSWDLERKGRSGIAEASRPDEAVGIAEEFAGS